MAASLLTRAQSPSHAARLYVFAVNETNGDWLPSLLDVVSTRSGRLAVREELARVQRESRGADSTKQNSIGRPGPRRVVEPAKRTGIS